MRPALGALSFGVVLAAGAACSREDARDEGGGAGGGISTPVTPTTPAVEPDRARRRFYLTRSAGRCAVEAVDDGVVLPLGEARCPEILEDGERVRLVGRTCLREGPRERPVRCPYELLQAAKREGGS